MHENILESVEIGDTDVMLASSKIKTNVLMAFILL